MVWTERALNDLCDIEDYIAQDSPRAAVAMVERLIARVETLREHPRKGRMVPEVGSKDIREVLVGNYRLVYRLKQNRIEVLQVFQGSRLLR